VRLARECYFLTAFFLVAGYGDADANSRPVADEDLRLIALQTIFPGTQIVPQQGMRINLSWPEKVKPGELFFPDIFADEKVY
jgi:hypothetical protein